MIYQRFHSSDSDAKPYDRGRQAACACVEQYGKGLNGGTFNMRRVAVPTAALLVASAGLVAAAAVESGLQPGDNAGAYNVLDVTGPNKGKSLCYR